MAGSWAILPVPVAAHSFGERYTLPLPLWLYAVGAGLAVGLSFVIVGFVRVGSSRSGAYPRRDLLSIPWLRPLLTSAAPRIGLQILAVALLILVIATGFFGTPQAGENLAPVFVWVFWWIGFTVLVALVANLWPLVNPWSTLYGWGSRLFSRGESADDVDLHESYPAALGIWPACLGFLAVVSVETVFNAGSEAILTAFLVIVYSAVTWFGMATFGRTVWLRQADVFSVYFDLFGRFAPIGPEPRDQARGDDPPDPSTIVLRPWAAGLLLPAPTGIDRVAFMIIVLASLTFDGIAATQQWFDLSTALLPYVRWLGWAAAPAIQAGGLITTIAVFAALYAIACWLGRIAAGSAHGSTEPSARALATGLALSFVPIALAYQIAHYFTALLVLGQSAIPLASDPFGWGWNLFGTADYTLNLGLFNSAVAWYVEAGVIVIGHVIAVYLAEILASRLFGDGRQARRSQYPIIVLMILYTMSSLWILAQPLVQ